MLVLELLFAAWGLLGFSGNPIVTGPAPDGQVVITDGDGGGQEVTAMDGGQPFPPPRP